VCTGIIREDGVGRIFSTGRVNEGRNNKVAGGGALTCAIEGGLAALPETKRKLLSTLLNRV
jgi:hypothetical protein